MILYAVKNDWGYILTYSVRNSMEATINSAIETWGRKGWKRMQELGATIVQLEAQQLYCQALLDDDSEDHWIPKEHQIVDPHE